jgi:AcrR family transcriptional regulator
MESVRRGRPRDPDAEPRIRQCAVQLLLERGLDRMTVDEIAARAGVGKATIYRRWPSKTELAHDAMNQLFNSELSTVEIPDTGTLRGDLEQVYRSALRLTATPAGGAVIRLAMIEAIRDPEAAAIYRRFLQHRVDLTAAAFDRARRRGEPVRGDADPRVPVEWLTGALIVRAITHARMPPVRQAAKLANLTMLAVTDQQ